MCSPVQEYLFDACIDEKLEGILLFDERSVCKRDKTLHGQGQCHGIEYTWRLTVQMTLCYNQATYPRRIKCEWFKSCFEGVGKDLSLLSTTMCHNLSRPGASNRWCTHHSLQGLFYFLRHIIALLFRTTSSSASSSSALLFWAHSYDIIPPFVTLCSWRFKDRAKRNRKKKTLQGKQLASYYFPINQGNLLAVRVINIRMGIYLPCLLPTHSSAS